LKVAARISYLRGKEGGGAFKNVADLIQRLGFERKWQNDVISEALTVKDRGGGGSFNYYQATGGASRKEEEEEEEEVFTGLVYWLRVAVMALIGLILVPFALGLAVLYGTYI